MNEVQRFQVNRCFGGHCPKDSNQKREQKIKEVLLTATERRRANKEINNLLLRFHGKSLIKLLPVIKRRYSQSILNLALERVEGRRHGLEIEDVIFLEEFKTSLEKPE